MKRMRADKIAMSKLALGMTLACVSFSSAGAQTTAASSDPVFEKMLSVNKGLSSYKAHINVETRLPLGSFTLHGTLYDRGEQSKVVFDNVPAIAKSSVENQPSIGPASSWRKQYAISVISRTTDATTYHLVPLVQDAVRSIDAVVQNASGLVQQYVWSNKNGMTITSNQSYETVGGYQLVQTTSTRTRGGGVHADSETTFTDYQLNVSLPDSVFSAKQ
jgi:outer membrane lipoprotein-sorting protein